MNRYFGTHTLGGEWHALIPRYLLLGDRVRGKRILDIGCGTGIGSSLLLEMGADSVQGVDHRPEVVDLARIKHDKVGLDFHVMFWESLEFEDDFFDAVVCLDPTSPVTDHNLLLEVRRVLKTSGEYICAVERTKVAGMESLLPRYGYDSPSNQVNLNQANERVPQLGELSAHFDTLYNIVQRPHLSYLFEPKPAESGAPRDASEPAPQAFRHIPKAYRGGMLTSNDDEASAPSLDEHEGRWLPINGQLLLDQDTVSGIELFFCGDADLSPPPASEIRLPYYDIMDRLGHVIEDLQSRQSLGGEPSSFDEVLDAPEIGPDARSTQEYIGTSQDYQIGLDDAPTGVRHRPTTPAPIDDIPNPATLLQHGELESYRDKISAHYRQIRHEIDALQHHTRAALIERDDYIHHLVQSIHTRQPAADPPPSEPQKARGSNGWREETTQVFKIATLGKQSNEQTLDELAELDEQMASADLERQIASLQSERGRIDELLAVREQRLAELTPDSPADGDRQPQPTPADEPGEKVQAEAGTEQAVSPTPNDEATDGNSTDDESTDGDVTANLPPNDQPESEQSSVASVADSEGGTSDTIDKK